MHLDLGNTPDNPEVLLVCELTERSGVDVMALISEDLDEPIELADRVVVRHGRIAHETPAAGTDPPRMLDAHWPSLNDFPSRQGRPTPPVRW